MKKPQLALRPAGAFLVNREEGRVKRLGVPLCGTDFREGWRGRRRGCERERWFGMIARLPWDARELLPAGVQKSTAENLPCFSVFSV